MTRLLAGLALGIALVFPGAELIKWMAVQVLGVYTDMTLTEACLGMIIILQAIILVRGGIRRETPEYPARMAMTGSQIELHPRPRVARRPSPTARRAATRAAQSAENPRRDSARRTTQRTSTRRQQKSTAARRSSRTRR